MRRRRPGGANRTVGLGREGVRAGRDFGVDGDLVTSMRGAALLGGRARRRGEQQQAGRQRRGRAGAKLRNMSNLSFQNLLNDGGGAPGRAGFAAGQPGADLGQAGLHFRPRGRVVRQAGAAPRRRCSPRSSGSASARARRRARRSGSPWNKTARPPAACRPANSAASPCKTSPWAFPAGAASTVTVPLAASASIGVRHGVPALPFDHPYGRAARARSRKKPAPAVAEAGRTQFAGWSRSSRSTASSSAGR